MQENIKKVMKETVGLEETKHASAFSLNHPKIQLIFLQNIVGLNKKIFVR